MFESKYSEFQKNNSFDKTVIQNMQMGFFQLTLEQPSNMHGQIY